LVWNKAHTALYGSAYLGLPNICKYQGRKFGCGIVFSLVRKNGVPYRPSSVYPAFTFTYVPGASPSTLSLPSPGLRAGTFLPDSFESH